MLLPRYHLSLLSSSKPFSLLVTRGLRTNWPHLHSYAQPAECLGCLCPSQIPNTLLPQNQTTNSSESSFRHVHASGGAPSQECLVWTGPSCPTARDKHQTGTSPHVSDIRSKSPAQHQSCATHTHSRSRTQPSRRRPRAADPKTRRSAGGALLLPPAMRRAWASGETSSAPI